MSVKARFFFSEGAILRACLFLISISGLFLYVSAVVEAQASEYPRLPGYRAQADCRAGFLPDTVPLGPWNGPVRFLSNQRLLQEGIHYHIPGDTLLVRLPVATEGLAAHDSAGADKGSANYCIVRYTSPALPQPRAQAMTQAQIPVLRPRGVVGEDASLAESSFIDSRTAGFQNPSGSEADTGKYALALSGSKSLAVTAGEGGAIGVDAALYVNVKGQVAENVWIEGTLSDQNTPVQPEGSTTTLREVDVKYLRVYGRQYEYLLGDYLLTHGREGEDRFAIQAEGARLRYGENGWVTSLGYARSKGLFHSDTLRGVDGKQRGYYLRGRDGRTFITVLAGTERLWRNGSLLKRGIDYVIDYAQGRVDFLAPVWVTSENLFFAEYQYAEDTYPRIVLAGEAADTVGRFRFSVRAIQETEDEQHPAAGFPDATLLGIYRTSGDLAVIDSMGARRDLPERRALTAWTGEWEGGEAGRARLTVLGSLLDRNLYSGLNDEDNLGWSSRYQGTHVFGTQRDRGGSTRLILEPEHEHRSHDFASFRQAVEPRAFRDAWNLDASVGERDFDANRLRLTLEPYSGWQVGGGVGYASGVFSPTASDTLPQVEPLSVTSRRAEVFARVTQGATHAEITAEAKRARDPGRRDNDRERASFETVVAGWVPHVEVLRDAWGNVASTDSLGRVAQSELWQPRMRLESPALANLWVWSSEADALYGRSNYGGGSPTLQDSLLDIGVAQRLQLLGWGPVIADLTVALRQQRVWRADLAGERPSDPEVAAYDQAEANLSVSDYLKGYGVQMHYRAARTAETPLVEAYEAVAPGRGDYISDSLLNAYYRVESGGDHIRIGMVRDTTIGSQPYQDLQWSAHLDLSPGKWPAPFLVAGGVLADLDFTLDLETDHQDSAADPVPLPRFTDAQIEAVRSGRARYEPSVLWNPGPQTDGMSQSGSLRYRREYAKGAGLYAFRERSSEWHGEYRRSFSDFWEATANGSLESRWRQGLAATTATSRSDAQRGQGVLYRRLPFAWTLIPSLEYRHVAGEDAGFPLDLQGIIPRARVEKGWFFGGRASAEYGAFWLFGTGEGGYFVTDGYRRGVTHRFEAVAQSEVRSYLHLNANYLARLDPDATAWSQRFSAEVKAVF